MAGYFSHLECSIPCGAGPYDPRQAHQRCTCGAPLFARYDLTAAKKWPKTSLAPREPSMWRYHEILPLLDGDTPEVPVTLGEGWTPLIRARRLAKVVGLDRIYIKDESTNPTMSIKARGMAASVTRALHIGERILATGTTGSSGAALAAYASRAGLDAKVFIPRDARPVFGKECELLGASVTLVDGSASDAVAEAGMRSAAAKWYDVSDFKDPYEIEGEKTIGYEIAEQLAWKLPDWIVVPVGAAVTIIGLWKAFAEMSALGWTDPIRRPHLVCVQAAGCAPLVRAFGAGAERATPWQEPHAIADDLRVSATSGDLLALRALRESGGLAMAVGDAEMVTGMRDLGRVEGISGSLEGGAALHATRVLVGEGRIKAQDTVVVVNTLGSLKQLDAVV